MSKFENMLAAAELVAKRATMEADATIEGVRMRQAARMVDLFKDLLAEHNLHNHEIRITFRYEECNLTVNRALARDMFWPKLHGKLQVIKTLQWIESQLTGDWLDQVLDGTLLNPPKDK